MSRPRARSDRYVIKMPAWRKTDADATEPNQPDVTRIFCGKDQECPYRSVCDESPCRKLAQIRGLVALSAVNPNGGMTAMPVAPALPVDRPTRVSSFSLNLPWALVFTLRSKTRQK